MKESELTLEKDDTLFEEDFIRKGNPKDLTLKPFKITTTIRLEATDTKAALLKASQLLGELANGTPYEFNEFNVKVE